MTLNQWEWIGLLEGYVALLALCLILAFYSRKQKHLIGSLRRSSEKLLAALKRLRKDYHSLQEELDPVTAYRKVINDQLLVTRQHHQSLSPDQDIALDLSPEAPESRQLAALRHAYLIAEKEAAHASEEAAPNWEVLEGRLLQLTAYFQGEGGQQVHSDNAAENDEDNASLKAKVEELQGYKDRYQVLVKEWQKARAQAQDYYDELNTLAEQQPQSEEFEQLLANYHDSYGELAAQMGDEAPSDSEPPLLQTEADAAPPPGHTENLRARDEISKLRELAADQHKLISALQQQLSQAKTEAEKDEVIGELSQQLERQARFVKESDTCIKLMENELREVREEVGERDKKIDKLSEELMQIPEMRQILNQFSTEAKEMLTLLSDLERLNSNLLEQLALSCADDPEAMASLEAQLATLREQYQEIDQQYLELQADIQ